MRVDNIEKILIINDPNCNLKQLDTMLNLINNKTKLSVIFNELHIPIIDLVRFFSYFLQNNIIFDLKVFIKDKELYKEALKYKIKYVFGGIFDIYPNSILALQNLGYCDDTGAFLSIKNCCIFKLENNKLIYEYGG